MAHSNGDSPRAISSLSPMGLQQPRLGALRRRMSSSRPPASRKKTNTLILKGTMKNKDFGTTKEHERTRNERQFMPKVKAGSWLNPTYCGFLFAFFRVL